MPVQVSETWSSWPILTAVVNVLSALAWPGVLLFLTLHFTDEIKTLFLRLSELGPRGAKFQAPTQATGSAKEQGTELDVTNTGAQITDPVMREFEKNNRKAFEAIDPSKRDEQLIWALTVEQLHRYFALAYSDIFGSQIWLLRQLNSRDLPRQECEMIFSNWLLRNPQLNGWTLDQYLNYLLVWRLIEQDGDRFRITETGRSFLGFLSQFRLREDRLN